jgi:hypothetical protein
MVQDPKRPVQDIAGVAGGGLEDDRDRTPSVEPVTRTVTDDRGLRKRVGKLNDKEIAPADDATRTITGRDSERDSE